MKYNSADAYHQGKVWLSSVGAQSSRYIMYGIMCGSAAQQQP